MVKDTRLDIHGKPPMGGEFPVAKHPRAYLLSRRNEDGGAYYVIKDHFAALERSKATLDENEICPACLLIEVTMHANNTKSVNTARCILKAAGKKIP